MANVDALRVELDAELAAEVNRLREDMERLREAHAALVAKWARRAARTPNAIAKYEIRQCISELAIATDRTPEDQ